MLKSKHELKQDNYIICIAIEPDHEQTTKLLRIHVIFSQRFTRKLLCRKDIQTDNKIELIEIKCKMSPVSVKFVSYIFKF